MEMVLRSAKIGRRVMRTHHQQYPGQGDGKWDNAIISLNLTIFFDNDSLLYIFSRAWSLSWNIKLLHDFLIFGCAGPNFPTFAWWGFLDNSPPRLRGSWYRDEESDSVTAWWTQSDNTVTPDKTSATSWRWTSLTSTALSCLTRERQQRRNVATR